MKPWNRRKVGQRAGLDDLAGFGLDGPGWHWQSYAEARIWLVLTTYQSWLKERTPEADQRRLREFRRGSLKSAQLYNWLKRMDHPGEMYLECPLLDKFPMGFVCDVPVQKWLENRPWLEPGENPPPEWLQKWLPMVVIWLSEKGKL